MLISICWLCCVKKTENKEVEVGHPDKTVSFLSAANNSLGEGLLILDKDKMHGNELLLTNLDKSTSIELFTDSKISEEIIPFAFHYDNYLLVFRCIEKDSNFYRIILNEETSETISISNSHFYFCNWEEFILKEVLYVDFDSSRNPIRASPVFCDSTQPINNSIYGGYLYQPISLQNDWLEIKWEDDTGAFSTGWVKWKDGDKLLIDFYYF